jgi:TPR repeat protein
MKILVMVFTALALSLNAHAAENDFQATTDKALTAGSPEAVLKALNKEIARGNQIAALHLGRIYRDGKLVPQDFAKAKKFFKTAATGNLIRIWYRHGHADAQYELAMMLQSGSGGKPDHSAAESWFLQAAEQGNPRSQLALAKMYFNGGGIKRNIEQAFFWSSIAAASLSDTALKEAEQIRDQAQAQLDPKLLAKSKTLVNNWKHKT